MMSEHNNKIIYCSLTYSLTSTHDYNAVTDCHTQNCHTSIISEYNVDTMERKSLFR